MKDIIEFLTIITDIKLNKYQKEFLEMTKGQKLVINTRRWSGKKNYYQFMFDTFKEKA